MNRALRCHYCGRNGVELHHVTGRAAPGAPYLDRLLVVPLCKRHHDRDHELLRRRGFEFLTPGDDQLGHRVARILDFLGRSADFGRPVVLEGEVLKGFHALLLEALDALGEERWDGAA